MNFMRKGMSGGSRRLKQIAGRSGDFRRAWSRQAAKRGEFMARRRVFRPERARKLGGRRRLAHRAKRVGVSGSAAEPVRINFSSLAKGRGEGWVVDE